MQARNTYDLIDGGSEIPVTGANVSQFVHLYVQHVLYIFSAKALTVCLYAYLYFSTPTNACHVCVYVCGGKREREKLCGCKLSMGVGVGVCVGVGLCLCVATVVLRNARVWP